MVKFLSVREARRSFSRILLDAAYGVQRTVVVRHHDTVAGVVSPDDVDFLLRYRPTADLRIGSDAGIEEERKELEVRADELAHREFVMRRGGGVPDQLERIAAERNLLAADEARLAAMIELMKVLKN